MTSLLVENDNSRDEGESSFLLTELQGGKEQLETSPLFEAITMGSRTQLARLMTTTSTSDMLQNLLNFSYPNTSLRFHHDSECQQAAVSLLGESCSPLSPIHIACFLGDEELAVDILNLVANAAQTLDARKVLFEFMGRVWGAGNTVLHLASFMGMEDLVKRLLEMGANFNRRNDLGYRPVDCTDDELTRARFQKITKVIRVPLRRSLSIDSAFISSNALSRKTSLDSDTLSPGKSPPCSSTSPFKVEKVIVSPGFPIKMESSSKIGLKENLTKHNALLLKEKEPSGNEDSSSGSSNKDDKKAMVARSAPISALGFTPARLNGKPRAEPASPRGRLRFASKPTRAVSNSVVTSPSGVSLSPPGNPASLPNSTTSQRRGRTKDTKLIHGGIVDKQRKQFTSPTSVTQGSTRSSTSSGKIIASSIGKLMEKFNEQASGSQPRTRAFGIKSGGKAIATSTSTKLSVTVSTGKQSRPALLAEAAKSTRRVRFSDASFILDLARNGELNALKEFLSSKSVAEISLLVQTRLPQRGLTPLHLAASYKHLDICKYLVECGANIGEVDAEGWTVLHCAAAEGHTETVTYLLEMLTQREEELSSWTEWTDDEGQSVLEVAASPEVKEILLSFSRCKKLV